MRRIIIDLTEQELSELKADTRQGLNWLSKARFRMQSELVVPENPDKLAKVVRRIEEQLKLYKELQNVNHTSN